MSEEVKLETAATVFVVHLAGNAEGAASVHCTATAVYLLDRVKLGDARLDPASIVEVFFAWPRTGWVAPGVSRLSVFGAPTFFTPHSRGLEPRMEG